MKEFWCDNGDTEREEEYTFFYGKRSKNYQLGLGFLYISESLVVQRVECVRVRVLYVVLKGG
jgi:hypothetical protein